MITWIAVRDTVPGYSENRRLIDTEVGALRGLQITAVDGGVQLTRPNKRTAVIPWSNIVAYGPDPANDTEIKATRGRKAKAPTVVSDLS